MRNRPSGPAPPAKVGPARNRLTTPAQTAARVPARRGACSNAAPTFRQAPGKCVRTISIGSRKRKEWTLVGGPGPRPHTPAPPTTDHSLLKPRKSFHTQQSSVDDIDSLEES